MRAGYRAVQALRGRRVPGLGWLLAAVAMALAGVGIAAAHASGAGRVRTLTIPLPLGLPPIVLPGLLDGPTTTPYTTAPPTTITPPLPAAKPSNPLVGRAMWIWQLGASSGGSFAQIIATAKRYGVRTLLIKSSDGTTPWGQFNRGMIAAFNAAGLRVCAWQYIYGRHPADEARLGAGAVSDGAACLVIDAESEYQGRYAAAQRYLTLLRQRAGANYPIALAGFPYVDYHLSFPYSVFLGPGGAQYNMPQMYWRDIGTSVDAVYAHTYYYNRLYQRPIFPLGQVFQNPPQSQLVRFRQLSTAYGAQGVSWWDYQSSSGSAWRGISKPVARLAGYLPVTAVVALARKAKGDLVVWAQEHLVTAGFRVAVDGDFGAQTQTAVAQFQAAHGLPATGVLDTYTWAALLRYRPATVHWAAHSTRQGIARIAAARGLTPPPLSALLPGRDEFRGGVPGRGREPRYALPARGRERGSPAADRLIELSAAELAAQLHWPD